MPEFQLTDSILTSLTAQEPWPENVKLFQPYEVEQILLPDNASCLAVQAFLKMCNLPFEVEMRWNAEFMSPSGRVPFIKCGAFVVSELEPIVQFAANKGVTLCGKLGSEEKAEMRAYMSLITNVLVNAELYISWLDNDTYNAVTKVRNSSVYPWPLGWLQTRTKRNAVAKRLKALHWHDKTLDQVLADVEQCCNSLSQRLGDKEYFFGSSATPLDALVYGHMRALLSAQGPKAALMIKTITSPLLRHVLRVTTLTEMQLTAQEDYLLTHAFQLEYMTRRRSPNRSPQRSGSPEIGSVTGVSKGSKRCVTKTSKESMFGDSMFGFKPFASKQIIILNTKEGGVTCTKPFRTNSLTTNEEHYDLILELIDDILDKVSEIAFDEMGKLIDEKHDFEIVFSTKEKIQSKSKYDYIDTKERDTTNNCLDINDIVHVISNDGNDIINDDCTDAIIYDNDSEIGNDLKNEMINQDIDTGNMDSDGMVNNKLLAQVDGDAIRKTLKNDRSKVSVVSPTELDALVFGHVFTIITTRLPCRKLAETVRRYDTLVALARRVDEHFFKRA